MVHLTFSKYSWTIILLFCISLKVNARETKLRASGRGIQNNIGNNDARVLSLAQPLIPSSSEELSTNFSPETYSHFNVNNPTRTTLQNGLQLEAKNDKSTRKPQTERNSSRIQYGRAEAQGEYYSGSASEPLNMDSDSMICPVKKQFQTEFDSSTLFQTLGFHDKWIREKWFWQAEDFNFEGRFIQKFKQVGGPPEIKVFVVPHSHSDPGWLKTFEGYFNSQTKHTLDLAVEKLCLYPNMTFVWNEISFLSKWWEQAKVGQKIQFLQLIREGRLEVLTGGWVMADEATVNLYSLIDELVEGRQWVRNNLGVVPNVSWSIDPFGHGSTMPYLLKTAGIDNMVIQRLHYAWKKYLGEKELGNFEWVQRWDTYGEHGITCHNAPYDIYTTKHTCGPDPTVCLKFDFRNIMGEYSEYTRHARPVRELDLGSLASELVGQLQRTASLGPYNVVMFPLGDDFRFDKSQEWDQQYENYVPILNYINANYEQFRVDIRFGTVSDYFKTLAKANFQLPRFSGDFFPYSDVFVSARPAYWTGFYGTRPYWKKFYRETESHLRTAEILFTYAYNMAAYDPVHSVILRREYQNLIRARRHLALFAHHDGATGTSRKATMDDYGRKLAEATRSSLQIQKQSLRAILHNGLNTTVSSLGMDSEILNFGELPTKTSRVIYQGSSIVKKIVLFNSLSFKKLQLVRVRVTSPFVKVIGTRREHIESQINPVVDFVDGQIIFRHLYDLTFETQLLPLSVHAFEIRRAAFSDTEMAQIPKVSCAACNSTNSNRESFQYFEVEDIVTPTIVIGNGEQELYFNGTSGLLRRVTKLQDEVSLPVKLQFGGYKSVFRDSGAYLLKPDLDSHINIPFDDEYPANVIVVDGPVTSYVTAYDEPLVTTTRIVRTPGQGIHIENMVDLGQTAAEVYMRVDTWLNSTTTSPFGQRQPTMYTDQNGYTFERRIKVPWIGYEGNTYPVNTMAYIQDVENFVRFSVLVDRAHGFCSMHPGRLETLIERRTLYDDGRGLSEGVTDNKKTISNYILLLERLGNLPAPIDPEDQKDYANNLPTLTSHHLSLGLNYQPNSFGYDDRLGGYLGTYSLLSNQMPDDSHLINLRTVSNITMPLEEEMPSNKALMIVQKLGYLNESNCNSFMVNSFINETIRYDLFYPGTRFNRLRIDRAEIADLAGVHQYENTGRRSTLPIVERKPFEITSLVVSFLAESRRAHASLSQKA